MRIFLFVDRERLFCCTLKKCPQLSPSSSLRPAPHLNQTANHLRSHLSPTYLTHENHSIIFSFSLFQIPNSTRASLRGLPPTTCCDAFSSPPYQIPPLPLPLPPCRSSPHRLVASISPRPILRPYGPTRFDPSLFCPYACIYAPLMPVGMRYFISLSRSLPIQNTCHDSDLTRPSPVAPLLPLLLHDPRRYSSHTLVPASPFSRPKTDTKLHKKLHPSLLVPRFPTVAPALAVR